MWHNYSDITDQRGWDESQGLVIQGGRIGLDNKYVK